MYPLVTLAYFVFRRCLQNLKNWKKGSTQGKCDVAVSTIWRLGFGDEGKGLGF